MAEEVARRTEALPVRAGGAVRAALEAEHAPETRRAYASALRTWSAWARDNGVAAFPVAAEALVAFLADRHADGRSPASLRLSVAALARAHVQAGEADPTKHPGVRSVLKGLGRLAGARGAGAPRQARALTAEALVLLRAAKPVRRRKALGGLETWDEAMRRQSLDVALAHLLSDAGLRRSEAAALAWRDVERVADGSGRLTVRRSKTDPTGDGQTVALTVLTVRLLGRYARLCGVRADGLVFGLSGEQLSRRLARLCEEAGLGAGFSGHSGRVGLARRMVSKGAPTAAVQLQGRWKEPRMVARYVRREEAASALRWL